MCDPPGLHELGISQRRSDWRTLALLVFLSGAAGAACAVGPAQEPGEPRPAMEVISFEPPAPLLLRGDTVVSTVQLHPAVREAVWSGFSVQDPGGAWHDAPARQVSLPQTSEPVQVEMSWLTPPDAPLGFYRVVQALWSAPPGSPGAERLLSVDRRDAFRLAARREPGDRLDSERWERGDHALGRGGVARGNVEAQGEAIALRLPADSPSGAELRTAERVGHGRYSARLRTPYAPGSLTAFFLYADQPDGNDEIDIEIFNDATRRALLTVWIDGQLTHQKEIVLPFDPTAGFHEYTIDHQPTALTFLVDGVVVGSWQEALPTEPMKVMLNAWWPTWLSAPASRLPAGALVERVTW